MAHSHTSPTAQERLHDFRQTASAWLRADRVRTLALLSAVSLVLAFLLMLLAGTRFGLLSLTVITLALIGVTAGLLALFTWVGARRGRTRRDDLWDGEGDDTRPEDFLIGFTPAAVAEDTSHEHSADAEDSAPRR